MNPSTRRPLPAAGFVIALATLGTVALGGISAGSPTSVTDGSGEHVQTVRYVHKVGLDTDIDLGAPGESVGDQTVFRDPLLQNGQQIGTAVGVGQTIALTATDVTQLYVTTQILRDGQLAVQIPLTVDFAVGLPDTVTGAITGGTGKYRDARGQCVIEFVGGNGDRNVTCTIITGR